jgi:tetratricopeptide (TPR) repeat protein
MLLKAVRLFIILLAGACNSPQRTAPVNKSQYVEYMRYDSLARLKPDSSFHFYFSASENLADSIYKGTALQQMALILQDAEDYQESNESAIRSVALFNKTNPLDHSYISYNYNLLGSNCLELQRYDAAFNYYDSAIRYADSTYVPVYKINKGVAYQKTKEYDKAIGLYEDVLKAPIGDTSVYCRVRSNLAKARWLKDATYRAADEFHEARQLRELRNDQLGLNASYSHLADYYMQTRPDSARHYAEKMYRIATGLGRADDKAEALEKLVRLSSGSNEKKYFEQYDALSDSIQLSHRKARNQFADIRFNFEKVQSNNLVLEKDNSKKQLRIIRQRVTIYGALALFTILSVLGILWYKKRKRVQELQARNAIRESKLKTSQKVHDVVANGLYRIMNELEHKENIEKEPLLDKIENLYEQSRDLSYDKPVTSPANFYASLNSLLISFANSSTKVLIVGNNEQLWNNVTSGVKKELEYVLQELMVNMQKHSSGQNVAIHFERSGKEIIIRYTDDGVGLPVDFQQGNGIRNTGNRIRGIGGTISFEKNSGKGLRVEITIPITTAE